MEKKIEEIKKIAEEKLSCSAHGMDHVMRVYHLCLSLAEGEEVDEEVLKISALLHDIARTKEDNDSTGNTDHAVLGSEMAKEILNRMGFSEEKTEHIRECIRSHRYRTGNEPKTKEAMILFDADKLDILGSVGVARCYMFAGQQGQKIFSETPIEEYIKDNLSRGEVNGRIKNSAKHASNIEFEIKIKKIPEKLYTAKAKAMGLERVKRMDDFFKDLEEEIKGRK